MGESLANRDETAEIARHFKDFVLDHSEEKSDGRRFGRWTVDGQALPINCIECEAFGRCDEPQCLIITTGLMDKEGGGIMDIFYRLIVNEQSLIDLEAGIIKPEQIPVPFKALFGGGDVDVPQHMTDIDNPAIFEDVVGRLESLEQQGAIAPAI